MTNQTQTTTVGIRRLEHITVMHQNATNTTQLLVRIRRDEIGWLLCQAAATLFTIISVYLTLAAIIYKFRVWKKKRLLNGNHVFSGQQIKTISSNTIFSESNPKRRVTPSTASSVTSNSKQRRISALDSLIIAAGAFVSLRLAAEQQVLNFSDQSHHLCDIIADVHVVLYALPIAPIYIFLWLRQRILYSRPPLSLFNSRKVQAASASIIVLMVIAELVTMLVFTLTIHYKPGAYGCETDWQIFPEWVPWLMIMFFMSCFQILLLVLYIAPMIRMRLQRNSSKPDVEGGRLRKHGEDRIMRSIKRVCAITFACVLSDAVAFAITKLIHVSAVSNLVYDLNLLVNLVGITCSFGNWKQRIFPTCSRSKTRSSPGKERPAVSNSKSSDTLATIAVGRSTVAQNQPVSAQGA